MAYDVFLKLDDIKGESTDAKHKDEIDIESFQWGLSQTAAPIGGGGSVGKASFQDFSFTADISTASPQLFLACASGEHIKEGVITVRKPGTSGPLEYYTVKLTDCLVSLYNQAAVADGDLPMDEFALNYSKIEITYRPQNTDGTPGTPVTASWNIEGNTKI